MWRLKQFMPKDQAGLEGKTVEVGSLKLQVRSTIAQGGFSCVYLARDAQSTKQYALKHIICNDTESLDLVKKEVAVMKTLRDHPNVVTMHAQAVYDMGRTKECFLVMEYCEKMLVNVLDSRGAGYFEEKQLLLMFRDICNAVYAMHCQHPPIAHRDLKAENVLLGGDGLWKLCDFGSTSTNHKRFEKPDEMGVEEDIIRKHTTPAYRAPEMWDLYRRELISEKVDIWALGCLLYRMAYFKSAFDGESKLQILNGNYRIPDVPKYTVIISNLIKDMLNASPEARPDVMQVWRRVNDSLPMEYRKAGPDKPPGTAMPHEMPDTRHAAPNRLSPIMPSRAPPPPPHLRDVGRRSPPLVPKEAERRSPPLFPKEGEHRSPPLPLKDADRRPSHGGGNNAPSGAFWSTQYAQEAQYDDDTAFSLDKAGDHGPPIHVVKSSDVPARQVGVSPPIEHQSIAGQFFKKSGVTNLMKRVHGNIHHAGARARDDVDTDGYEMRIDDEDLEKEEKDLNRPTEASLKITSNEAAGAGHSTDEAFSAFVAEFQNSMNFTVEHSNSGKESLQLEVERLREELKQVRAEKADISSKYEKLTAICRSQRQEIHELKSAMAVVNSEIAVPGGKDTVSQTWLGSSQSSQVPQQQRQQSPKRSLEAVQQQQEKQLGSIWDLQEGLSVNNSKRSSTSETQAWQAFGDTTGLQLSPQQSAYFMKSSAMNDAVDSPRFDSPKAGSINGQRRQHHARAISFAGDTWGFVQDSFTSLGSPFQASRSSGQVSSQSEPSIGSTTVRDSSNSTGENRPLRSADRSQPAGWAGF